jgi:poly-gamma-glutamate capsule biosynthesis protein CapA/YwtB (metallophosphatase superfamily)
MGNEPAAAHMLDWSTGRWRRANAPEAEAEILISADWASIRAFDPIIAASPEAIYGDLLPVLRASDLRVTNLECTLDARGQPVWKSGSVFGGRPEHLKGLASVPFEIVTLASNHAFDYGIESFQRTTRLLGESGIRHAGAGLSAEEARRPLLFEVRGIKLALINFCEGEDFTAAVHGPGVFGWEIPRVIDLVRQVREGVDLVLVIGHCGVEYIPFPPPYVTAAFQRIAEAGADLVIGHHPHVPQGVQIHRNVPICYSLGNFVFYQETDLLYRKLGYLVKAGLARGSISHVEILPYEIGADRLSLLAGERRTWFFEVLEKISRPLLNEEDIRAAWHGFLRAYGLEGFRQEVRMILEKMEGDPRKGAAMFRNRILTMQHREHWADALTRIVEGTIEAAPQWAYDLTREWLTRRR